MTTHRTFYLVPADAVIRPTVAIPRPLAPTPNVASAMPVIQKTAPLKRPLSTLSSVSDPIEALLGETPPPHQRKRECLDHLTHEQKMNRRKMKNRIAAQTARDRKKYRSQRLEDVIRELLEQNEILREENEVLRMENQDLTQQNRSLIARLEGASDDVTTVCQTASTKPVVYEEVLPYEWTPAEGTGCPTLSPVSSYDQPSVGGLLQSDELEKILNDFAEENLEFDLDELVQQLPAEEGLERHQQQPSTSVELQQSDNSSSDNSSSMDESLLNVPRCSPLFSSSSFPSPSTYSGQMDELLMFEEQKLVDDPMLSSPSNWPSDNSPHALSPFSDSFQREFFQMLE